MYHNWPHLRYANCLPTGKLSNSGRDVRQYLFKPSGQQMRGQQSWSVLHVFNSQNSSANGSFGHFRGIKPSMAAWHMFEKWQEKQWQQYSLLVKVRKFPFPPTTTTKQLDETNKMGKLRSWRCSFNGFGTPLTQRLLLNWRQQRYSLPMPRQFACREQ